MPSFFRYPGGKSKLRIQITNALNKWSSDTTEYREPFFGGGCIGIEFLKCNPNIKDIWINDKDDGISCLWTSVINYPELLKDLVHNFKPSVEKFDEFKSKLIAAPILKSDEEVVQYGFMKLAIHQISYSGLGTKSGGPLGGREQKSKYLIDCRWSVDYICKKIDLLHDMFSKLSVKDKKCSCLDFADVIADAGSAVIYLDPPYYVKGNDLYQVGFTQEDHSRLADLLKKTHLWVLSYDDCDEIRELYKWAHIKEIHEVNYSITALKDKQTGNRLSRAKTELLITPF